MDFYTKCMNAATIEEIVQLLQPSHRYRFLEAQYDVFESSAQAIIEEMSGIEKKSDILLMICTLCIISGNEVDPAGTALWNAVVTKQKENVDVLLKFGACYKRIQFDTVDERTRFYDCLTDMNLEIVDCKNNHCHLC